MPNLGRYFRTLRHLRFSQLTGQICVRLRKRWRNPVRILANVRSDWRMPSASRSVGICPPVPSQNAAEIAAGKFHFVGREVDFGSSISWDAPEQSRLWTYNLHYFDWLWSLLPNESPNWQTARRLTIDWIQNHPPGKSACGWEPYPVSLRLMNWAILFGVHHRDRCVEDEAFCDLLMQSFAKQIRWLELNLETHIQANHLLENLAALTCVGSIFEGDDAGRVIQRVIPSLERELNEQILGDGCHYERSPMYHLRMLWLVEMLEEIGTPEVLPVVTGLSDKMRAALACLRHPDGEIAQFNDAAMGIYLDSWKSSSHSEIGAWALPEAGYYGYRNTKNDYLVVDAGAVGPDYQPGHAHADYLSFELSFDGERLITDTGIGTYEAGVSRAYDRSTSAHNTVEINGRNSAEVWGCFRVGRRVVPKLLEWVPRSDGLVLEAEHCGYAWLPCGAVHRRRFEWTEGLVSIEDVVKARSGANAVSRIHFAPGCRVILEDHQAIIEKGCRRYFLKWDKVKNVAVETRLCHPKFGESVQRQVLVMRHQLVEGANAWHISIGRVRP